jgi:hypothetical protein
MNTPRWNQTIKELADRVRDKPVVNVLTNKVAVIIEPRDHEVLTDLLVWMVHLLSPHGWKFIIYCGTTNAHRVPYDIIEKRSLNKANLTTSDYNNLLTSPVFWDSLPYENILIFQTDSVIVDPNLDEFLIYDYVGAPWENGEWHLPIKQKGTFFSSKSTNFVGNGGLSLRRKSGMLRALRSVRYNKTDEDVFYSMYCHKVLNIPLKEIARHFSVESMFYPRPKGVHKFWSCLSEDNSEAIYSYIKTN